MCFNVDRKKNIVLMKDLSENASFSLFSKKITVTKSDLNVCITRYPENNFRVLIPENGGRFEIWEIAIVSQDGLFFLTSQMTYEAKCYRGENGEIICPRFEWETKWPQLMEIVKPIFEGMDLLPISDYLPPSPPKAEGLPKNHGKVVWWNYAQGLGMIVLDQKRTLARVHWKGIHPHKTKRRLKALYPGEIVSYQKLDIPSRVVGKPTLFQLEVKGVILIPEEEKWTGEKKNERIKF